MQCRAAWAAAAAAAFTAFSTAESQCARVPAVVIYANHKYRVHWQWSTFYCLIYVTISTVAATT